MFSSDFAKFIGIILVVFGHSLRGLMNADMPMDKSLWSSIDKGIYLFHMPLFFFLSGLFLTANVKIDGLRTTISKNAVALIAPMVIWSYIQFGVQFFASAYTNGTVTLSEWATAPFPPKDQFWFLGVLFAGVVLITPILKSSRHHLWLKIILGAFLVSSLFFTTDNIQLWMKESQYTSLIGNFYLHIPFLLLGCLFSSNKISKIKVPAAFSVLSIAAIIYLYVSLDFSYAAYRFILSALCVLFVYKLCESIAGQMEKYATSVLKICVFIGMNSLIIYLSHLIFTGGIRMVLGKIGIDSIGIHLTAAVIMGIICPLFMVPIGAWAGKKWPLLGKMVFPVRLNRRQFKKS